MPAIPTPQDKTTSILCSPRAGCLRYQSHKLRQHQYCYLHGQGACDTNATSQTNLIKRHVQDRPEVPTTSVCNSLLLTGEHFWWMYRETTTVQCCIKINIAADFFPNFAGVENVSYVFLNFIIQIFSLWLAGFKNYHHYLHGYYHFLIIICNDNPVIIIDYLVIIIAYP